MFNKSKATRFLSLLVACAMVFLLPAPAYAAEVRDYPYAYMGGDHSAVKVSHPDVSPNAKRSPDRNNDGIVDYIGSGRLSDLITDDPAAGSRAQNYSWAAYGYGDWVYVATLYNAMNKTLGLMGSSLGHNYDKETMKALLNTLFNGDFYLEEEDGGVPGGTLSKINVKTGEVKLLLSKADGYECGFRNVCSYNDKLYFCGAVNNVPQIWQVDPETDECRMVFGMSVQEFYQGHLQHISTGIRGLCPYEGDPETEEDNMLIVSSVCANDDGNILPTILCAKDPEEGFEVIATYEDLFEYPAYHYSDSIYGGSIWEMVEFNGKIYVSICTGTPENKPDDYTMQSFALVRGERQADGTWTWTPVIGDLNDGARYTFGIDPERTRAGAGVLTIYDDYLYIGEYNDEEIAMEELIFNLDFRFMNENFAQSVSLYRMDADENIELVVGNPTEMFPEGGISGQVSGFGHPENQYIWRMADYEGRLYVGTFDTSSLLQPLGQFANFDIWHMTEDEWSKLFGFVLELLDLITMPDEEVVGLNDGGDIALTEEQKNAAALRDLFQQFSTEELSVLLPLLNGSAAELCETDGLQDTLTDALSDDDALQGALEDILNDIQNSGLEDILNGALGDYEEIIAELVTQIENAAETLDHLYYIIDNLLTNARYLHDADRGFDLYVSEDGVHFDCISTDGFGDPFNHGVRVFAETDSGLVIGTANPFYGTQVWLMTSDGEAPDPVPDPDPTPDPDPDPTPSVPSGGNSSQTPIKNNTSKTEQSGQAFFFADVPAGAYYHDAVQWAAENQITDGTGEASFSPELSCTRAEAVTFLWRAAGSPATDDAMEFIDVPADAWYAQAVRWAVSQGITLGTSADTFSPDDLCTRSQMVAFLWRSSGQPVVNYAMNFTDVPENDHTEAIRWAVSQGITLGSGTDTFGPNDLCTRAQTVTFLWRACQ